MSTVTGKPLPIKKGSTYEIAIKTNGVRTVIWPPCKAREEMPQPNWKTDGLVAEN